MIFACTLFLLTIACIVSLIFLYRVPNLSDYDHPTPDLIISDNQVSPQHQEVLQKLNKYHSLPRTMDIGEGRRRFAEMITQNVDLPTTNLDIDGLPAEWVCATEADPERRLLYIHGGAFFVGSPRTHRHITAEISRRTGLSVLSIDYRMQPEHKVTHCHEDARKAYQWILEKGPSGSSEPQAIFVAGDSAGGNLTLALIAWARDHGWRKPNGAICLSPVTDITLSGPSWKTNLDTDPFLGPGLGRLLSIPGFFRNIISHLTNGKPSHHQHLSPIFGPLKDLPPSLIQVSRDEVLYSDAIRYTNKAKHVGSEVILQVWPVMVHVFQGFDLPETDQAFDLIAEFVAEKS